MFTATLSHITAEACVPEQLVHYVRAVSGRKAVLCQGYAAYIEGGRAVLAAYPGTSRAEKWDAALSKIRSSTEDDIPSLASALADLSSLCSSVSVISPFLPREAPEEARKAARSDCYWQLPLPAPRAGVKLRNMLSRAGRELTLSEEFWKEEHQALVSRYLSTRQLSQGTRKIFSSLGNYVNASGTGSGSPGDAGMGSVVMLAARRVDNSLAGCCIGDFSGLQTCFYMFSFRHPEAPPGTADLLLSGLVGKAEALGHTRMNLGLGINPGIGFFKKKWGALPFLPYVETSWDLRSAPGSDKGLKGILWKLLR